MVRVQQARDYSMAQSMAAPDDSEIAVLVAGNYHARQDLGVPNYLLAKHNNLSRDDIVSIAFMEVSLMKKIQRVICKDTATSWLMIMYGLLQ
jgi:uncharacterized iron-regulated protein